MRHTYLHMNVGHPLKLHGGNVRLLSKRRVRYLEFYSLFPAATVPAPTLLVPMECPPYCTRGWGSTAHSCQFQFVPLLFLPCSISVWREEVVKYKDKHVVTQSFQHVFLSFELRQRLLSWGETPTLQ